MNLSGDQKKNIEKTRGTMGGGHHQFGRPVEKAKQFKKTFQRLLKYLSPEKSRFIFVFVLAIMSTIFSIVGPMILGKATTELAKGVVSGKEPHKNESVQYFLSMDATQIDFNYIYRILWGMLLLFIVSSIFAYFMNYLMAGVTQKTVFNMRNDVNEKLNRLPLRYFDEKSHGEILSRVTNDIDTIANSLQQSLTQVITAFVSVFGILLMMFAISPVLTLIALVTLPLSALFTMIIAKNSKRFFSGQQKCLGDLNGHVEEMLSGHTIVKAFGHEQASIEKFETMNEALYQVGWKAQFMSGIIFPTLNFVSNMGYVFICIVGGVFVAKRSIEIGDIQAFIQYMRQFTMPIVQLANISNILQSTVASAERVFEIMDESEELPDPQNPKQIEAAKGAVSFRQVRFSYEEEMPLITDLNLEVQPGQTIAIVGQTGAGKTTLVNLLMRFYEIQDGEILIDGTNIKDMSRHALRSLFGMVLQDTWLFNGTIRDNIAYGRKDATGEEVLAAAKLAQADHFIRTLPEGYDTVLNEELTNLSQGQKQLITIARAILANPKILLLDEATSSVDTRTEVYVQTAMHHLMEGRTSFVIAHRLSTIKDADVIVVMHQGSIIEQGTHQGLLKQGGYYCELYRSQFTRNNTEELAG